MKPITTYRRLAAALLAKPNGWTPSPDCYALDARGAMVAPGGKAATTFSIYGAVFRVARMGNVGAVIDAVNAELGLPTTYEERLGALGAWAAQPGRTQADVVAAMLGPDNPLEPEPTVKADGPVTQRLPWRPIETAPMDAEVLLWYGEVTIGWWSADGQSRYWHLLGFNTRESRKRRPTHWMPLPEGPEC